jgi:hypothetical protein
VRPKTPDILDGRSPTDSAVADRYCLIAAPSRVRARRGQVNRSDASEPPCLEWASSRRIQFLTAPAWRHADRRISAGFTVDAAPGHATSLAP